MKQSQQLLENAATCARLAERATDAATQDRFKRAELAWRALNTGVVTPRELVVELS